MAKFKQTTTFKSSKANYRRVFAIIGAVIVVFLLIIIFKSPTTNNSSATDALAPQKLINQITSIPDTIFNQVGNGKSTVKATLIPGKPYLSANGLPQILYMGAEYCPYCATERWPMIIALSKFGTFKNLETTHSSLTDVYPDTQTFSFHGSSFTSRYLSFVAVERYTNIPNANGYTTLDTPTSSEQSIMNTYDAPPYTSSSNQGAIPFIYFAGKYLIVGATYSPQPLLNKSYQNIANDLSNPNSDVAQGVLGATNNMTATICKITNNQPATACTPVIKTMETSL
jgi:hypothetical protein